MKLWLATIGLILCSLTASAHDFEVDGIYYNVISDTDLMVEVTFKGDDREYDDYEEYIGAMVVPSTVSYEGKIYRVIGIGGFDFHSCTNVTSISISEGVETIGIAAFTFCPSLERVYIPATMISIDESAFNLCEKLTTIVVDDENIVYCDGNNNCIVEKNTETLLVGTISGHIPNGIKYLAIAPFSGRKMLEEHINIPDGVISIGGYSFIGSSISSIRIPTSLRSSKSYAFGDVDHSTSTIGTLESLNVVCIDDLESWFYIDFDYPSSSPLYSAKNLNLNNNRLETISIPEGITIIKPAALAGWNGKKIVIPESTTSIGNYAFYDCASLTSIVIPASVSEIGFGAFGGCEGLTSITVNAINPPAIRELTFENVDKSIPVYVPAGSVEAYQMTEYWSKFTNICPIDNEYPLAVSAAGYATLYLDYAAEIPDNVKAYIATSVEGDRLMMTQVTGVLPANTGVIVRAKEGTYTFVESDDTPANVDGNLLSGTATDTYITAESGYRYYVLAQKEGMVGMYRPKLTDGRFLNNANKAYLALESSNLGIFDEETNTEDEGGQLSNRLRFDFGGTTSIDNSEIINHNSETIYDLHGRRVENSVKGVYIVNGKKVVFR